MTYHVIPVYPLMLIKRRTHTIIKANSISFVFLLMTNALLQTVPLRLTAISVKLVT
jgi:hypothetical protein